MGHTRSRKSVQFLTAPSLRTDAWIAGALFGASALLLLVSTVWR